jgi:aconitate decarboxylase
MDDYHIEAPIHTSSIIIPAVFAAAEQEAVPIDGSSFLLACIVGYEIGPRVGLSLGGAHLLTVGWHSGAIFGPAAAAAAACKLLKLPSDIVEDAMGMACTQACGLMSAQFESMIKRMQHGFAARSGLWATYLAREGFLGIKKIFERGYGGFLNTFTQGSEIEPRFRPEEICKGLGQQWEISRIREKPYALMAGTHCTVDCIRKLQGEHPERMKELMRITTIVAEMTRVAHKKGGWVPARPLEVIGAQMSVPYAVALQLVDGEILPSQFAARSLNRDELWDVIGKVECRTSEEFDNSWAQRVTITFDDGEVLTTTVKAPRGVDPALSNEEIVQKWRSATKDVISETRQREIENVVLNLEGVADVVSSLKDLLGQETVNILE